MPRESAGRVDLESLVAQHYERLLRVAVLVCREHADAEDAVQMALERAWRHAADLRDPDRGAESRPSPELRLPIHSFISSPGQPTGWRQFISGLYPSTPGCYAVQVDTLAQTQHLVFQGPS